MTYLCDGRKFTLHYAELKEQYLAFKAMKDDEFMAHDNLILALHFAVFVCWIKEVPSYNCLSDTGIIHEIAHRLHLGNNPVLGSVADFRQLFDKTCELA